MSANFDYVNNINKNAATLSSYEQILGKGLNIPNNATNSGARKIMDGTHQSHTLVLSRAEVPYVATGFENRFGDESSTILKLDDDYEVIGKVSKFSNAPNHHYWLILRSLNSKKIHIIERRSYRYITELYGYLMNNTAMDALQVGQIYTSGTEVRKSTGFDEYDNKTNGCNLNVAYMATDNNMEDSVIISDTCAKRMSAPLFREVEITINENDIPLNLYGNDSLYKIFPDIGEDIRGGILLAYRREKREEAIYTQTIQRLEQVMMSDEKITLKGKVIDLDIHCNNIDNLSSTIYNQQFKAYYMDRQRMWQEIVNIIGPYDSNGFELSYDAKKLFVIAQQELMQKPFIDKRKFSNIHIRFIVMEERLMNIGDKCSDRYGGKGVVSTILPQKMMPQLPNGEYADMIKNSSTMYNRENPGQLFELSLNYISMNIIDRLRTGVLGPQESMEAIYDFLHIVSPIEEAKMRSYVESLCDDDKLTFLNSILESDCIYISSLPITEVMTMDKLMALYDRFSWIQQAYAKVPVKDSKGNTRYVSTRRPMIIGKQYVLRLKQVAEEKFSSTSLSSTNIMNENAKSKANKNYKELYSNTPIKFGPMESGDFNHMGTDIVIGNLMIYSLSPRARRLSEELYTGDPYDVNIRLDSKSKNRSVEKLNARLKTMGYRLTFKKVKRVYKQAVTIQPLRFFDNPPEGVEAIKFHDKDYDFDHYYKTLDEIKDLRKRSPFLIHALSFGQKVDDKMNLEGKDLKKQ